MTYIHDPPHPITASILGAEMVDDTEAALGETRGMGEWRGSWYTS